MPTLTVSGMDYHYVERGSGPLLLFGHGTFLDHSLFEGVVDALAPHYRCVSLDWPGHGRSGWRPEGWGVADLVEAIPQLIGKLGEQRATLIGLSIGAAVFLRVALDYPAVVQRLVYLSASVDPHPPEVADRLVQIAIQLRDGTPDERRALLSSDAMQALLHAPGWRAGNPQAAERELQIQLGHDREAMPLVARVVGTLTPASGRLHEIRCPMLAIFGDHDPGSRWAEVIAAGVPGARVRVMENAGHHLPYDAPAQTLREIREFLNET
ncbi:alpha/beta hydrolase [Paraburkholderia sp. J63]|uniref:alpha/beta fold hydrolase n=1 Tax=Paraburkholderia sp. J63 TaxID=2805434 RepID=UPI002ABE8DAD|nr:alpha/beta hydrolase [Paraburkholderia sp. J63]